MTPPRTQDASHGPVRRMIEDDTNATASATARMLLAALPQGDATAPHTKGRVLARLHAPKPPRIPTSMRILAFAVLLLASAALAESRMHILGSFTSSSSSRGAEQGGSVSSNQAPATAAPRIAPSASIAPLVATAADLAPPEPAMVASHEPEAPPKPQVFPAAMPSHRVTPTAVAVPSVVPTQEAARSMEEAELVLDGLRALRKEGNPARASALFSQYLAKHPNGALAEDAMGYRLEAADRTGSADTGHLADAYLRAYPHGRYVQLAERLRGGTRD